MKILVIELKPPFASGVLRDPRVTQKLKDKFYRTTI
jgi:hypothetical protein